MKKRYLEQSCPNSERVNEYRNQEVTMFYTILVKRQHIRRVVCDPYLPEDPSDALPQVRLHFDLNCPVLVRNGFVTDATMKDNKKGRGVSAIIND